MEWGSTESLSPGLALAALAACSGHSWTAEWATPAAAEDWEAAAAAAASSVPSRLGGLVVRPLGRGGRTPMRRAPTRRAMAA